MHPTHSGTSPGVTTSKSKIIAITVSSPTLSKSLAFTPNDVNASPGDILQFQFYEVNHSVTQSAFSTPCQPIQAVNASAVGANSGFVPVTAGAATIQTFNVPVRNTEAMYTCCAQGPHCQLGMVMTVNAAKNGTLAVPASSMSGGVMGSVPAADAVKPPQ